MTHIPEETPLMVPFDLMNNWYIWTHGAVNCSRTYHLLEKKNYHSITLQISLFIEMKPEIALHFPFIISIIYIKVHLKTHHS